MMRLTEDEFIEKNNDLQFFDESSALDFYRLISMGNISPAMLILIDRLEKLGWYLLNNNLGLLKDWQIQDSIFMEELLSYRLDDFVFTLDKVDGLQDIYGNYLVSDFFAPPIDNMISLELSKKEYILQRLAFKAATKKDKFLKDINDDVLININSRELPFLIRLVIYRDFLESCTISPEIQSSLSIVYSVLNRNQHYLEYILKYLNLHINDTNILSRLNLLKIRNDFTYYSLIDNLKTQDVMTPLIDMLDIIERP